MLPPPTLVTLSQTVKDIKTTVGVTQTVPLLNLKLTEIRGSLLLVNYLNPKVSQVQTVEEKTKESILPVHTLKKKTKVPLSTQTLMKDLQVTQNLNGILGTPHHGHPGQIAEGHARDRDRDHEDLELVHLTPDWTDLGETEVPVLKNHIIMSLTEGHTDPLHAEREGALVHTLIEIGRVQIPRMTAEKQDQEEMNQASLQLTQVHTKSLDHLLM